jgi:superfamily I DNA/RNA helicase
MAKTEKTAKQLREEAKQLLIDAEQLAAKELSELKDSLSAKVKPHLDKFVDNVKELELSDNVQSAYDKFQTFIDSLTDTKDLKEVKGVKKRVKRSKEEWAAIVAEANETSVAETAKKHGIATSQIYTWKSKLG